MSLNVGLVKTRRTLMHFPVSDSVNMTVEQIVTEGHQDHIHDKKTQLHLLGSIWLAGVMMMMK